MLPDSQIPKGKLGLEYIAIGFTIIGGMVALMNYLESQKTKKLQEVNADLERQIKELQLATLTQKTKV